MLSPMEELYFWSQIMSDHGDFIFTLLSPKETEMIKRAEYFKTEWYKTHQEVEALKITYLHSNEIINRSVELLKEFIEFKKLIVERLLKCEISFNHVPSFINHMLNEANEFYRNLYLSVDRKTMNPYEETILLHKLWLRDASGHADAIIGGIDPVESLIVKDAEEFKKMFDQLFIKAYELGLMYERTKAGTNQILHFNEEVCSILGEFIEFLEKIKALRLECKVLGFIVPDMIQHMINEEHYYLMKFNKAF